MSASHPPMLSESTRLAIAAHLHVLLRRKTGRVTDTEWLASNLEYATEIIRFARARAAEDDVPELREWADKLHQAMVPRAVPAPPPAPGLRSSGFTDSRPRDSRPPQESPPPDAPRYVGGIR